jgi:pilus assembly protein CpaB
MKIFGGKGSVVLAIALGALTSYMAWRYVDQANQQGQQVEMAPVVVANTSIPARTIITPDMVRIQKMPAETIHPQAVQSMDLVLGKVVKSDVVADEPVLSSRLFLQRGESGLAFMIPDGMRAVSVGFTELIGTGGMVTPGDHVDVLGVFEAPANSVGSTTGARTQNQNQNQAQDQPATQMTTLATEVLQNIQVLAVAQHLEGEDTTPKQAVPLPSTQPQTPPTQVRSDPAPQPAAKTATLAVNPEDSLKLVLAESKGQIRLALRQAKDKSTPAVPQVPMAVLLSPSSASPSSASALVAAPAR